MKKSEELFELMVGARRRVIHLYAIVFLAMLAISSQIKIPSPMTSRELMNLCIWAFGCVMFLGLGLLWYRMRAAATVRLTKLYASGELHVQKVATTRLKLFILPIGWEVDVDLESGEHLSFGYWTYAPCQELHALLLPNNIVH